jgi:hypothetical protein
MRNQYGTENGRHWMGIYHASTRRYLYTACHYLVLENEFVNGKHSLI